MPAADTSLHTAVAAYYRDVHVRARMQEYCGGWPPSAAYIAPFAPGPTGFHTWETTPHLPPDDVEVVRETGQDVARSLWDTARLLFFLDLDHQNVDWPGEPFVQPAEVFAKLEPTYRAVRRLFRTWRLPVTALATGRGYHFIAAIPLDDLVIDTLADVVPAVPSWHASHDIRRPPWMPAMPVRQARAWAGLGCVVEYAAHRILREATASSIPVVFNGTVVGTGPVGRECASIDFSHMGDPLDARHVRIAFSTYQFHRLRPDIVGEEAAAVPVLAAVPRRDGSLARFLGRDRSLDGAAAEAARTSVGIPNAARGVERLLAEYRTSALAAFHQRFYRERAAHTPAPLIDLDRLPPCLQTAWRQPNDLLLKPAHVQHVVRGLAAHGWSAADVATLIQRCYEADHGWGERWYRRMDPATRAEFDVRVFAGLIAAGADRLVDFNCVSAQEKGLCPFEGCSHDLRADRDHLRTARL